MTPESRNSPLLDNGSLNRVSAATDTRCYEIDTSFVATDGHRIIVELFEVMISIRFAPSN
jgi:hypothetical protein